MCKPLLSWDTFLQFQNKKKYTFNIVNDILSKYITPFHTLKLIRDRKTKAEEVSRKPAIFYCQSSIFSQLVFPEASCVKCECCLFLNSSFMNHCPLLPLQGKTWGLDADKCQQISSWNYVMAFVGIDKISSCPEGLLSLVYSNHKPLRCIHIPCLVDHSITFGCCHCHWVALFKKTTFSSVPYSLHILHMTLIK